MSIAYSGLRRPRAMSKRKVERDIIRFRTAEIRCDWDPAEYKRRRDEARRRQRELFGVATHGDPATIPMTTAEGNPYRDDPELLAILGVYPAAS